MKSLFITHIAMESTGIYWKPVFNILEADFYILLVNAHHVKNIPGHKTDKKDKKPERKRKNLMRLGVDDSHAYQWSQTRKGGWAVAQSPILVTTITVERLKKRGYESMLDYYLKVFPGLNEPLYTGPVRTVV